ncbi:MAG: helix-turn-helix domain-containing protein [Lentisphaeria bacterium]|nr:helix-turn-helix domain-containing protein [Lentisphaeria bacterium]
MARREINLSAAEYLDLAGLPLRLIRRDPEGAFPLHRHEFSELVVIFGGAGTHLAFGERHRLSPGDVFLIGEPGPPHGFVDTADLALYNVLFDRKKLAAAMQSQAHVVLAELSLLELVPGGGVPLHLGAGELRDVLTLLRGMEHEQGSGERFSAVALTARFILLLVELVRLRLRRGGGTGRAAGARGDARFAELLMLLAEHPERDFSRRELADKLCVSESTLQRLFRARTGFSPHGYLLQLRLKKAETLLLESELSVGEVAAETGFADSNYFCRRFRRYARLSPLEFRKRRRG